MSGLIPGVRNNGVILVGLASLPGSTQMLVVTAAGLIESQAIPSGSGAAAWNDITGKPTEFPPSAHNHPASQITDFAEAVDDEVATLLQAGTDVSVTYNDAANTLTVGLGANVPRLNGANTFTQPQVLPASTKAAPSLRFGGATNTGVYAAAGGTAPGIGVAIGGQAFFETRDSNSGIVIHSAWGFCISSGQADGTADVRFVRNATGPTFETRAAGGLKVCNAAGSAVANVECANITAALISCGTYTVATLPSAAANAGRLAQVTDSSVTTNGSAVAGGGSNRVLVFSTGSTWDVVVA